MTRRRVLTDAQVREIRATYLPHVRGRGYRALAKRYGVGESTIRDAVKLHTYASAIKQLHPGKTK
jgi:transposase